MGQVEAPCPLRWSTRVQVDLDGCGRAHHRLARPPAVGPEVLLHGRVAGGVKLASRWPQRIGSHPDQGESGAGEHGPDRGEIGGGPRQRVRQRQGRRGQLELAAGLEGDPGSTWQDQLFHRAR